MIHRALQSRSISLKKMLLFCGIVVGLMAGFASAQENATNNYTCTGAELASYANFTFCIPPEVVVTETSMKTENYSSGSEVVASMLFDGSRVALHLIYPCQMPERALERAELKMNLEAYNPSLAQATYNDSVPEPTLWGQIENQMFIAYQPSNQTIALVLMDMAIPENVMTSFLNTLMSTLVLGVAPASNCPGVTSPETTSTASELEAEVAAAMEEVQENETATASPSQPETVESTEETIATGKEKMAADMAAAQAKMDELKKMARK